MALCPFCSVPLCPAVVSFDSSSRTTWSCSCGSFTFFRRFFFLSFFHPHWPEPHLRTWTAILCKDIKKKKTTRGRKRRRQTCNCAWAGLTGPGSLDVGVRLKNKCVSAGFILKWAGWEESTKSYYTSQDVLIVRCTQPKHPCGGEWRGKKRRKTARARTFSGWKKLGRSFREEIKQT